MFDVTIEGFDLTEKEIQFLEEAYRHLLNQRTVDLRRLSDAFLLQAMMYFDGGETKDDEPFLFAATILLAAWRGVPVGDPFTMYERLKERMTHEEHYDAVRAFAFACQMERLRRLGLLEEYDTDDPFDPHAPSSLKVPEEMFRRAMELCGDDPRPENIAAHIDELMYAALGRRNRNN